MAAFCGQSSTHKKLQKKRNEFSKQERTWFRRYDSKALGRESKDEDEDEEEEDDEAEEEEEEEEEELGPTTELAKIWNVD
jgi:hypothetical protein